MWQPDNCSATASETHKPFVVKFEVCGRRSHDALSHNKHWGGRRMGVTQRHYLIRSFRRHTCIHAPEWGIHAHVGSQTPLLNRTTRQCMKNGCTIMENSPGTGHAWPITTFHLASSCLPAFWDNPSHSGPFPEVEQTTATCTGGTQAKCSHLALKTFNAIAVLRSLRWRRRAARGLKLPLVGCTLNLRMHTQQRQNKNGNKLTANLHMLRILRPICPARAFCRLSRKHGVVQRFCAAQQIIVERCGHGIKDESGPKLCSSILPLFPDGTQNNTRVRKSNATRSPSELVIQHAKQSSASLTRCVSSDFANHELVLDRSGEAHLEHTQTDARQARCMR